MSKYPLKFVLSSKAVGEGVVLARIVKPEPGDFCMSFAPGGLTIFSYDKRRYVQAFVPYSTSPDSQAFSPEEVFITPDRTALFDADLEAVTVKINEASVSVKAEGGGQSRSASLKRRAKRSKRTPVPSSLLPDGAERIMSVRRDLLEEVLGHLMCSAIVGKTEEEMRVNQIHFYSSESCGVSMTRFYGTVVRLKIPVPDFSIIGTDAPAIRTFSAKASVGEVSFSQTKNRLFVSDGLSCLSLTKVSGRRPPASLADNSVFEFSAVVGREHIARALSWAGTAVQDEGTSRVRFSSKDGSLSMSYDKEQVSDIPFKSLERGTLDADFQVRHLKHVVDSVQGDVRLSFSHPADSSLLCISPEVQKDTYEVHHYMKAMVER